MLSIQDCLDFCDLDCGEIEAIAEHEHIPIIVAAEMSNELLQTPEGVYCLHCMILENLNHALEQGDTQRASRFNETYQHLRATHPLPQVVADQMPRLAA